MRTRACNVNVIDTSCLLRGRDVQVKSAHGKSLAGERDMASLEAGSASRLTLDRFSHDGTLVEESYQDIY